MNIMKIFFTLLFFTFFSGQVLSAEEKKDTSACKNQRSLFSWSQLNTCDLKSRGGTTTGSHITLDTELHAGWLSLQEEGLSQFEKDRRAILAMAGGYRASFEFLETVGYVPNFTPSRPYKSWGTEYVYVVENSKEFISLQHILVMFFEVNGETQGPMIVKHWRQDWQYEKRSLSTFRGNRTWKRKKLKRSAVKGTWAQSVFQVDDSPRYESYGKWQHYKNFSTWLSGETWRPLPRREHTVRDDYQVLEGRNRHTIVANGWVHEEENKKLNIKPGAEYPYIAKEMAVNRYERVTGFDFSAGDDYWKKTGPYWADVRNVWVELTKTGQEIIVHKKVKGDTMYAMMFEQAEKLTDTAPYDSKKNRAIILETLLKFID